MTRAIPSRAQLKAALGLTADQPEPPMPSQFASTPLDLTSEQLYGAAWAQNPRLKAMEAEVRMAETGIRLARISRLPDFNLRDPSGRQGYPRDDAAIPWVSRCLSGGTRSRQKSLPRRRSRVRPRPGSQRIRSNWPSSSPTRRSCIGRRRAPCSCSPESLLPMARQALEIARSGYSGGTADFAALLDAKRSLLEFQLAEVEARTRRELALAKVSLLIAGVPPPDAPILTATGASPPTAQHP